MFKPRSAYSVPVFALFPPPLHLFSQPLDFVLPLFSWSYELLFPQPLYFDNDLRCPPVWGYPFLQRSIFQPSNLSTPLLTYSCSCELCVVAKNQVVWNHANPNSLGKTPGVGVADSRSTSLYHALLAE